MKQLIKDEAVHNFLACQFAPSAYICIDYTSCSVFDSDSL